MRCLRVINQGKAMLNELNVFVSVGGTANEAQENFVKAVEDRLRSEGLIPHTIGRNTFSSDAPLKAITDLMDKCSGTVVIALERTYFQSGIERQGGPKEKPMNEVRLPTPWNHIEAAMAYSRGLPLMVIVETGLRSEGLLEAGNDWFVQSFNLDNSALTSPQFNGVLASWKHKMAQPQKNNNKQLATTDFTVGQLIGGLKPTQLWSLLGSLAVLLGGTFALGANLLG
jgi:hypothetical protein